MALRAHPCALKTIRRLRGLWTSASPDGNPWHHPEVSEDAEAPAGANPIFHGKPLPVSHPAPSASRNAEAGIPAGGYFDNGARAALWRLWVGWEGMERESLGNRVDKASETSETARYGVCL
jgi:hypothetical protein